MTRSSKSETKLRSKWQFEALGAPWVIETTAPLRGEVRQMIERRIKEYDGTYSRFRDDSLVSRLRQPGSYTFPADFPKLYGIYARIYELTNGKMTPLIGKTLEEAGYDSAYSFEVSSFTEIGNLHETVEWDGNRTVKINAPAVLDFGAAGKGYAVDIISGLLEHAGYDDFVVDASGDMYHCGAEAETVGLEDPRNSTRIIGTVTIENQALCASASNRRRWKEFHHIVDPQTHQPLNEIVAAWVIASETLVADALATALFFTSDTTALQKEFTFEYVRMWADGTVDCSAGFGGELFI